MEVELEPQYSAFLQLSNLQIKKIRHHTSGHNHLISFLLYQHYSRLFG